VRLVQVCYGFATMIQNPEHLQQPVMSVARRDVATLLFYFGAAAWLL
jgi:hypothetical protein